MMTLVGGTDAASQELGDKQLSFTLGVEAELATIREPSLDALHMRVMSRWGRFIEYWARTRGRTAGEIDAPKVLAAMREFDALGKPDTEVAC
jgi:hypothetical protein